MAAVSAMRRGSAYAGFVTRLRDQAKAGKLIAIALARTLLTIANAVLRDEKAYAAG
jgi:hypothetical protein